MPNEGTVAKSGEGGQVKVEGYPCVLSEGRFEPGDEVVSGEEVTLVVQVEGPLEEGAEVSFDVRGVTGLGKAAPGELFSGTAKVVEGQAKLVWAAQVAPEQLTPKVVFLARMPGAKALASKVAPLYAPPEVVIEGAEGGDPPKSVGVGAELRLRCNPENMPQGIFRWKSAGGGAVAIKSEPNASHLAVIGGRAPSKAEGDLKLEVVFERSATRKTYPGEHSLSVFQHTLELCLTELPPEEGEEEPCQSVESPFAPSKPVAKGTSLVTKDLDVFVRDDTGLPCADKQLLGCGPGKETKPANYHRHGCLAPLRPMLPIRVSFSRALADGKACAISEGELSVRLRLQDPEPDLSGQSNRTIKDFFSALDAAIRHPEPNRGHNGVQGVGGERPLGKTQWIHQRFAVWDGADLESRAVVAQVNDGPSKEFNQVVIPLPASAAVDGAQRSDLHLLLRASLLAGDSYRFSASVDGHEEAQSGIVSFWKRVRVDGLALVPNASAGPWDGKAGLDKVKLAYREAFIDLELPSEAQRKELGEAEWKSALKSALSGIPVKEEDYQFKHATLPNSCFGKTDPAPLNKRLEELKADKSRIEAEATPAKVERWKTLRRQLPVLKKHLDASPDDKARQKAFGDAKSEYQELHTAFGARLKAVLDEGRETQEQRDKAVQEVSAEARRLREKAINGLLDKAGLEPKGFYVYLGPKLHRELAGLNGFYMGDRKLAFFDKGQGGAEICGTLTHEMGHALYLRHSVTKVVRRGSTAITYKGGKVGLSLGCDPRADALDHDPAHALKCVMSYTRDRGGEQLFCGYCQLILRMWDRDGFLRHGSLREVLGGRVGGLVFAQAKVEKDQFLAPPASLKVGEQVDLLLLTAPLDDDVRLNVTTHAVWASSEPTVLAVKAGVMKGLAAGSAKLSATFGATKVELALTVA